MRPTSCKIITQTIDWNASGTLAYLKAFEDEINAAFMEVANNDHVVVTYDSAPVSNGVVQMNCQITVMSVKPAASRGPVAAQAT